LIYGLALALISIIGVLLVNKTSQPNQLILAECPAGQLPMIIHVSEGTLVQIADQKTAVIDNQLSVPIQDFIGLFEGYPEMHHALVVSVTSGTVITRQLDLISLDFPLVIFTPLYQIVHDEYFSICTIPSENEELARRGWRQVVMQ
jgi:hypothetical protein